MHVPQTKQIIQSKFWCLSCITSSKLMVLADNFCPRTPALWSSHEGSSPSWGLRFTMARIFFNYYYFFLLGLLANKVWLVVVYSRLHRVLQCFDVSCLNLTILWHSPQRSLNNIWVYLASAFCILMLQGSALEYITAWVFLGDCSISWPKRQNKA